MQYFILTSSALLLGIGQTEWVSMSKEFYDLKSLRSRTQGLKIEGKGVNG